MDELRVPCLRKYSITFHVSSAKLNFLVFCAPVVLLCRINMDLAFACLQVVDGSKIVHMCCRYLRTDECAELGNKGFVEIKRLFRW